MTPVTVLIFVILLGVIVLAHEFGHYIVAVRSGIKAEEFGFGFPPRLAGAYRDGKSGRWRFVMGNGEVEAPGTVWSLNWIPFGGFVRMKGEDCTSLAGSDTFGSKSVGTRVAVLAAGVIMNIVLAWALITGLFAVGFPQSVSGIDREHVSGTSVMIVSVVPGSPAAAMGLKPGDRIRSVDGVTVSGIEDAKRAIDARLGKEVAIVVIRGAEERSFRGTPRTDAPSNEGALGISFSEMGTIRYPWYEAPIRGAEATWHASSSVAIALATVLGRLVTGQSGGADVTGPVGIVYATGQVSELGFAYLVQFAAILSINLAIFNILPIPALDGGRILFVLIEKFKGAPVREVVEQRFHQIGFLLLILLMAFVTARDIAQYGIVGKIWNLLT